MIKTDLEISSMLKSAYFQCEDKLAKRRVREFLSSCKIKPIEKRRGVWLYREADIYRLNEWHSQSGNEKAHRTTKSRVPSKGMDAYEKALALLN